MEKPLNQKMNFNFQIDLFFISQFVFLLEKLENYQNKTILSNKKSFKLNCKLLNTTIAKTCTYLKSS